jgi:hypothetical protein
MLGFTVKPLMELEVEGRPSPPIPRAQPQGSSRACLDADQTYQLAATAAELHVSQLFPTKCATKIHSPQEPSVGICVDSAARRIEHHKQNELNQRFNLIIF